ncbi:hypothetical protein NIE88_10185 [Sporolactobacillus shoreicorticis]|uniref:Uncharacterized protein n=1 Tax=Sporolactobacillus shoreicorticis TaxID=1923877 RepID=A0ABW5S8D2_9BACL|nr:hypothetical protein [Sporolactobacillus shoreicorticis]MCO7126142.1 hypothetical protein [Sporolactobacillus shoreicorticis]
MRSGAPIRHVFTPREIEHFGHSVRMMNGNLGEVDGKYIVFLTSGAVLSIASAYWEIRNVRNENGQVIAKRIGKRVGKLWAVEGAFPRLAKEKYTMVY